LCSRGANALGHATRESSTVPVDTSPDKVVSLSEAVAGVADGAVVALGGGLSSRLPMALVRELCRQQRRDLHLVGSAHGIDVDLLIAAGAVGVVEESYVGFEQDLGVAPAYRSAIETGAVELRETCCATLLAQLRAAEYGIPFMPVRGVLGSTILQLHPEYRELECPFTGERLLLAPALSPDVALLHAVAADAAGNVVLPKPYVLDVRFAYASRRVIVSTERILEPGQLKLDEVTIPHFVVGAVVEAPYGAHPASCYPDYSYDRRALQDWVKVASSNGRLRNVIEALVAEDESAYRAALGSARLEELRAWDARDRLLDLMQ